MCTSSCAAHSLLLSLSLSCALCLVRTACCAVCRLAVPVSRCQWLLHPSIFHLWPRSISSSVDHFSWSFEVFILIYLHKIFMHSACCSNSVSVALSVCAWECVCQCVCVWGKPLDVVSTQHSVVRLSTVRTEHLQVQRWSTGIAAPAPLLLFAVSASHSLSLSHSVALLYSLWLVHSTALAAFQL